MRYLLAVDPSLTCSGWALFCLKTKQLLAVGKVKGPKPAGNTLSSRYEDIQNQVSLLFKHFELSSTDIVLCEAETTVKDPKAAFKVERVRGIFETVARTFGCKVPGRVNPRTVHFEVMGLRGKQLKREIIKDTALQTAFSLYASTVKALGLGESSSSLKKHQDIVDAILVGHVAVSRINSAIKTGVPVETCF
jgi:Holliday junction resolvasome RuvABC endonuclease subunit